jgi:hypothetical protein
MVKDSGGGGMPVSGRRNAGCWRPSGRRVAPGLGDARGWVVGVGEQSVEDGTSGCPW